MVLAGGEPAGRSKVEPRVPNARSRITLYPVAPLGVRNQNPSCTGEGAGAPRGWDLSEKAASCSHGETRSHIHLGSLGAQRGRAGSGCRSSVVKP